MPVGCSSHSASLGFGSVGLTTADFLTPDSVIQLGYEPNRVDLLTDVSGVDFAEAYPRRIATTVGGIPVPIIDKASLVTNKRAVGRPQDIADVTELERP